MPIPNGLSLLLIGDSGTGKTRFLATTPKTFIFDFDKGTASLSSIGIPFEHATFKDAHPSGKAMPSLGIYPHGEAWPAFVKKMNEIGEMIDKGTCPYESLAFDSITTMGNSALAYVLKTAGRPKGPPQIQDWGAQMQLLETTMDQLTSWPLIKIVTAHIQRDTNDITKNVEMLPLVTGKLAGKIGIYFDEIYYCEVKTEQKGDKKERKYVFLTQSTSINKSARSRYNVPDGTLNDWNAIAAAFK